MRIPRPKIKYAKTPEQLRLPKITGYKYFGGKRWRQFGFGDTKGEARSNAITGARSWNINLRTGYHIKIVRTLWRDSLHMKTERGKKWQMVWTVYAQKK